MFKLSVSVVKGGNWVCSSLTSEKEQNRTEVYLKTPKALMPRGYTNII